MPDMKNPYRLALLVHFVEDPIDAPPFAEQKATNLSLRFLRFAGQGATGEGVDPMSAVPRSTSRTICDLEQGLDL
jgi:hypothetical protein